MARSEAKRWGLDPDMFHRQIKQESGYQQFIVSPAGAKGVGQIMPKTAKAWGVDPLDPKAALGASAKNMAAYIATFKRQGHSQKVAEAKALSMYNSGRPNAYLRPKFAKGQTYDYVRSILGETPKPVKSASVPVPGGV